MRFRLQCTDRGKHFAEAFVRQFLVSIEHRVLYLDLLARIGVCAIDRDILLFFGIALGPFVGGVAADGAEQDD